MPRREVTDYDIEVYTCGDCWLLAFWLHKLRPDLLITTNCCFDCWEHVAVTDGEYILDINGWQERKDWLSVWGDEEAPVHTGTASNRREHIALLCLPDSARWESCYMHSDSKHKRIAQLLLTYDHPKVSEQLTKTG